MLQGNRATLHSPQIEVDSAMNLTITVDKEVLKRARIRALEQDTSVNAVLRAFLNSYAGVADTKREAMDRIVSLSREASSRRGDGKWTREDLHER